MLVVVPPEEGPAEVGGRVDVGEAAGETGVILERLEIGLQKGVVATDPQSAEQAGDAEVCEELGDALARHGRSAIGVQGQGLRLYVLLEAGLLDETAG